MPEKKVREFGCAIKELTGDELIRAAEVAVEMNPANRPDTTGLVTLHHSMPDSVSEPQMLAALTSKYWPAGKVDLTVSFLDNPKQDLIDRILTHMNAWGGGAAVRFRWTKTGGQVRIARARGGYWSYLGTDVVLIPAGKPTMNLEGFTMRTPESEYRRVVRHETGHTLGFPHEHLRKEIIGELDESKVLAWYKKYQGWDESTTRSNVLRPLDDAAIVAGPTDETSIMAYQLPGAITKTGKAIPGGLDINQRDREFIAKLYPLSRPCADGVSISFDPVNKKILAPAGWSVEMVD